MEEKRVWVSELKESELDLIGQYLDRDQVRRTEKEDSLNHSQKWKEVAVELGRYYTLAPFEK